MGQSPSDIRAEIEETRARVGDEVDALSYKTDMPARVGDYVDEKKRALKGKVTGAKDAITGYSLGCRAERSPDRQAQGHGGAKPTGAGRRRGCDRVPHRADPPLNTRRGQTAGRDLRQSCRRCEGHSRRGARKRQTGRAGRRRQRERAWPGTRLKPSRADGRIVGWRSRNRVEERSRAEAEHFHLELRRFWRGGPLDGPPRFTTRAGTNAAYTSSGRPGKSPEHRLLRLLLPTAITRTSRTRPRQARPRSTPQGWKARSRRWERRRGGHSGGIG